MIRGVGIFRPAPTSAMEESISDLEWSEADIKLCVETLNELKSMSTESVGKLIHENEEFVSLLDRSDAVTEANDIMEIAMRGNETADLKLTTPQLATNNMRSTLNSPDLSRKRYRPAMKPQHEAERMELLRSFNILDTEQEPIYDSILWLATLICGTEKGAISLIDEKRQFFKAQKGLNCSETGRNEAFCSHAILQPNKLFVVNDTWEDERFAENPLVTGGPKIRFYAGMPMVEDNMAFGTLCVISDTKMTLTNQQMTALSVLARVCRLQLHLRRKTSDFGKLIDELQENERELVKQVAATLKASEDKMDFLAKMTHELRTPLNAILGYTQLLKEKNIMQSTESEAACIEGIFLGSRSLAAVVDSVLNFTKLLSGKWNLDLTKSNMLRMLRDIEKLNESIAHKKSLVLKICHDNSIPEIIVADSHKLEQMINSLILNAMEASKEGGKIWIRTRRLSSDKEIMLPPPQFREKVRAQQKRAHDKEILSKLAAKYNLDYVEETMENDAIIVNGRCKIESGKPGMKHNAILIEVEDQGSDSKLDIAKIFTPLEGRSGGTGLGLAIVKGIVQLMKGCIYVESKEKKGSIFAIVVPYGDMKVETGAKSPCISTRSFHPSPDIRPGDRSGLVPPSVRLCFAEDDYLSQKLIKRFLKRAGIGQCIMSGNGQALVRSVDTVLKQHLQPIVFTDIQMPVMDGIEALKEIRKIKTTKKIIVVALTGSPEDMRENNPGFNYILGKPIQFRLLRKMLNTVLGAVVEEK